MRTTAGVLLCAALGLIVIGGDVALGVFALVCATLLDLFAEIRGPQ